jgi:hypothetical protein
VDGRDISDALRRLWSVTYGHLDMIRMFLESGKDFGLFCEYDVMISKALSQQLPALMADYAEMQLDVMLLGYMTTFKIEGWHAGYATRSVSSERPHLYHNYPDHQWGVHLYMLDRAGAQKALDAFAHGYADANVADPNKPFSPDWTISKLANRALVYPMLAVEDGTDSFAHYGHQGQYDFHMNTFRANFVPGEFV